MLDLSHPEAASVNDGIHPERCSPSYTSVDRAAEKIVLLVKRTQLTKLDLESAYHMIPVHPANRRLLGIRWKGKVWLDSALFFGLRSAPILFNMMADCLQWILENRCGSSGESSCNIFHYLDNFLFVGPFESTVCSQML